MSVAISALGSVGAVDGTEVMPCVQAATTKKMSLATLAAYAITQLGKATAVTAKADGDSLILYREGEAKTIDATTLAAIFNAALWSNAAQTGSSASGDLVLINRAGAIYKLDVDKLVSYALNGVQSNVLNISGFDSAVLGGTDQFLVVQGSSAKKTTLTAIESQLWVDLVSHIASLAAVSATSDGDLIHVVQGGVEKTVTPAVLAAYVKSKIGSELPTTESALWTDLVSHLGTLTTASASTDTDMLHLIQGGVEKTVTPAVLAAYVKSKIGSELPATESALWTDLVSHLVSLATVSATSDGDLIHVVQGGVEKTVTPVVLANYIKSKIGGDLAAEPWSASSTAAGVSGDVLVIERGSTLYTITIDLLAAYVASVMRASAAATAFSSGDKIVLSRGDSNMVGTVDLLAAYVLAGLWNAAAVTDTTAGDVLLVGRGGAAKQITLDNLKTSLLNGYQATALNLTGLDAATLGLTDLLLVCQTGVPKAVTLSALETRLWSDYASYVAALSDTVSLSDADLFYTLAAGVPKIATSAEIASFVASKQWSSATSDAFASGDLFVVRRNGITYKLTVDSLASFVASQVQSGILNLSTLTTATLNDTDYLLVGQAASAMKTTVAALASKMLDGLASYVNGLSDVTSVLAGDAIYCTQGGVSKTVTPAQLADYAWTKTVAELQGLDAKASPVDADAIVLLDSAVENQPKTVTLANLLDNYILSAVSDIARWRPVTGYTSVPTSTSTIAMSDTSKMAVGLPIRYTYNSAVYYGVVTAVSSNVSITIAGAPLNVSYGITELCVGRPEMTRQLTFNVAAVYEASVQDILANVGKQYFNWGSGEAKLVSFSAVHATADSGTQPTINLKLGGNLASASGVQLSTAGAWVSSGAVDMLPAYYTVNRGNVLEIRVTAVGSGGTAAYLTVSCTFVMV